MDHVKHYRERSCSQPAAKRRQVIDKAARNDDLNDDLNNDDLNDDDLNDDDLNDDDGSSTDSSSGYSANYKKSCPISPPQSKKGHPPLGHVGNLHGDRATQMRLRVMESPIHLTQIRDLSEAENIEAVSLSDLIGHPLIKECWQFNYMFDVDFVMSKFDADIRDHVSVKLVHGFWKREQRVDLDKAASRYPNIELITAYMPEPFGTHHSKMMLLFRHDDVAQVIIHTANMIPFDWRNMCQAVWRSPLLVPIKSSDKDHEGRAALIGTGARFKSDLLKYLSAYGPSRTSTLVEKLQTFDFREVKAALVASVPRKQPLSTSADQDHSSNRPLWGWQGLRRVLRTVQVADQERAAVVMQISSIATLGQTDTWLRSFQDTLSTHASSSPKVSAPNHHIIFPTPGEIRNSLDGYASGSSIHTKAQSAAQQKQLTYLKPFFRHWSGSGESRGTFLSGRSRAAPHIKTYIRFTSSKMDQIDWAMLTSANLSTQAWGALPNKDNQVRISSWEIGVVFWPELFAQDSAEKVIMVPTFQNDNPQISVPQEGVNCVVGLRMPYDVPLRPYTPNEDPWVATAQHMVPDWKGNVWLH